MNEHHESAIDALLGRYLADECDASEKLEVEKWIAASEENRNYFDGLQQIWNEAVPSTASTFDTDASWKRMQSKLAFAEPKQTFPWRMVASIALLLVVGSISFVLLRNSTSPEEQLAFRTHPTRQADTLPDGSQITLNSQSELTCPKNFSGETREVNLKGQAFFDVAHDTKHPFIIHTDALDIRVVGTSFDVLAYPNSDSVCVSVLTGKVKCYNGKDTVLLTPGQRVVYHKTQRSMKQEADTLDNPHGWRTRVFHFNRTPLREVVRQLNDAYQVDIELCPGMENIPLRGDYENETIEDILNKLTNSFAGSRWEKRQNKIMFLGEDCQ